jgi:hypothetical protein
LARPAGLEPATPGLEDRFCRFSIQLISGCFGTRQAIGDLALKDVGRMMTFRDRSVFVIREIAFDVRVESSLFASLSSIVLVETPLGT